MDQVDGETQVVSGTADELVIVEKKSQTVILPPKILQAIEESINIKLKNHPTIFEIVKTALVQVLKEQPELLQSLYVEQNQSELIPLRSIDRSIAKREVDLYIEEHPGCFTSEIIESLHLDPILVGEILKELQDKSKIGNERNQ
jgi:hypothetical protein